MILMVPVKPEVPTNRSPRLTPGLVMVILLGICYLETSDMLKKDTDYIDSLQNYLLSETSAGTSFSGQAADFLKLRPLLTIAPAKADWDLKRVLYANFIHGSFLHVSLNAVGVFAGVRILSTFVPFLCSFAIFLIGGSAGLLLSILVSQGVSEYVPHVGSSGGLFALMGAYYIYNFHYRTRYFFWFPSKRGFVNLKTNWFFFFDVLLLELVLSAAQLMPDRLDSVDHIAHVVGFASGMILACFLRFFQRWPVFLQTRGEFLYWAKLVRPKIFDPVFTPLQTWLDLLAINGYNDKIKSKLCRLTAKNSDILGDTDYERIFRFFSPTFIRLCTDDIKAAIAELLTKRKRLPPKWLASLPYDSLIRVAKKLTNKEEEPLIMELMTQYQQALPPNSEAARKTELLVGKLTGLKADVEAGSRERTNATATGRSRPGR